MERWRRLDRASPGEARAILQTCCGSTRWVDRMLARRPFGSRDALLTAARDEWFALAPDDWREAFSHHPKIGERDALRARSTPTRTVRGLGTPRFAATHDLSAREQSGVKGASADVLSALAEGNRTYEKKFGFIFLVCATGKRADEMLALLQARMGNDPETELRIAAEEQAKITAIRLES